MKLSRRSAFDALTERLCSVFGCVWNLVSMADQTPQEGELILYRTANGAVPVECSTSPRPSG